MDIFLPEGFEPGRARQPKKGPNRAANLCVEAAGVYYPVLRNWTTGFSVAAVDVPRLSGIVNLYDGAQHLHQCLITDTKVANDEIVFAVKRSSAFDYAATEETAGGVQVNT
ncbi:hypothetical protein ABMC88_02650 [Sulfitobacter sp. HNIBRBA2951]|uniref:hypothetical protein n=1 Tax=Sulfitobacter aquimarinus TaxID=3158557 RepID=UPI0032DF1F7A